MYMNVDGYGLTKISITYRFRSKPAYNDEMYRTKKINNLKKTASAAAAVFLVQIFETALFAYTTATEDTSSSARPCLVLLVIKYIYINVIIRYYIMLYNVCR